MKESKLFKSLLATIVVVALGAPAIASAGNMNEVENVSVRVSYADLNIENERDAQSLYRRLKQASKQACDYHGGLFNAGSLNRLTETRRCYEEALSAAVEKLDNETVTNIHNG
jgi:UrcA family protein